MKIDPRESCANVKENSIWAFVHDTIAHPLMAMFGWPPWALRFHDYTSERAWPRDELGPYRARMVATRRWGALCVKRLDGGAYSVSRHTWGPRHSSNRITVILEALDVTQAVERAVLFFAKDGA